MVGHRHRRGWNRAWIAIALSYVLALQGFVASTAAAQPRADLVQIICSHGDSGTPIHHEHDHHGDCCRTMACCSGLLALGAAGDPLVDPTRFAARTDPARPGQPRAGATALVFGFNARGPPRSL
jgi:hypothetical protein